MLSDLNIAVLLPCYNEEAAIAATVRAFRDVLPGAAIYVYDNNSCDRTVQFAQEAGALVRHEAKQGKGAVVRRMFNDIEADIYVMADGDATYDATSAPLMIRRVISENLDMVVGARQSHETTAYRRGHVMGNRLLTGLLARMFGQSFQDILSGYRVFSHRFVKSFPVLSDGFEIETEISVHALELVMPVAEEVTLYAARPEGSASKLSTYRDGWKILRTMISLYRSERPTMFYGIIAGLLTAVALVLSIPLISTYLETGLVPRLPTAVLIMGLLIIATLFVFAGLILDTVTKGRRETKRLAYLSFPSPAAMYNGLRVEGRPIWHDPVVARVL